MPKCEKCGKDVKCVVQVIVGDKETEEHRDSTLEYHYPIQFWCIPCIMAYKEYENGIIKNKS